MPLLLFAARYCRRSLLLVFLLSICVSSTINAQSHEQPVQEQGEMRGNKRVGVWKYYDGDSLGLVMNYDLSRVVYVRRDTARYLVWVDSAWQLKRLNRAPRLLGSRNEVVAALLRSLRYPSAALMSRLTGHVVVTCVVDEAGQVGEPKVVSSPDKALSDEVLQRVNELNMRFLPGIYRGRPALTRVSFVVSFCTSKTSRPSTKAQQCAANPPYAPGSFNQITLTAQGL